MIWDKSQAKQQIYIARENSNKNLHFIISFFGWEMIMIHYFYLSAIKCWRTSFPRWKNPAQGSVWFSKKLKWKNKRLSSILSLGNSITPACIRAWEELHRLTYDNYLPTWNPSDTFDHDKAGWSALKVTLIEIQTFVTWVRKKTSK